jgi:hypothetical protein
MDAMSSELPVPPAVLTDPRARELLRVWAANECQHISLAAGLWPDPAAWGIVLVDLARHLSRAYEQSGSHQSDQALARIRAGFDAEWNNPTGKATGALLDEGS